MNPPKTILLGHAATERLSLLLHWRARGALEALASSSVIDMVWCLWDDTIAMQVSMKVPWLWRGFYREQGQSKTCSVEQRCAWWWERSSALQKGNGNTRLLCLAFPVGRERPGWIEAATTTRTCQARPQNPCVKLGLLGSQPRTQGI